MFTEKTKLPTEAVSGHDHILSAKSARSIMSDSLNPTGDVAPDIDLMNKDKFSARGVVPDPVFGGEAKPSVVSVVSNVISDAVSTPKTLMNKLFPNRNFSVQADISAMKPKVNSGDTVKAGNALEGTRASAEKDVQMKQASLKEGVKSAQREGVDAVNQTAKDNGVDVGLAAQTFSPHTPSTKMTAVATVAADLATGGGGSFVTALMQGGPAIKEIRDSKRNLSPKERKELAQEALDRAQSSGSNATAQEANAGATIKFDVPEASEVQFQNIDVDEFQDLMALNVDHLENQLPEAAALADMAVKLDDVKSQHEAYKGRGDINFDGGDMYVAAMDEVDRVDATAALLVGDSISSFGGAALERDYKPQGVDDLIAYATGKNVSNAAMNYEPSQQFQMGHFS